MGERLATGNGDLDLFLTSKDSSLLHSVDDLLGGSATNANLTFPVTDNDNSPEAYLLAALDDLGHAPNLHNLLVEPVALGSAGGAATAAFFPITAIATTAPSLFLSVLIISVHSKHGHANSTTSSSGAGGGGPQRLAAEGLNAVGNGR
jgi:hypothetical protein